MSEKNRPYLPVIRFLLALALLATGLLLAQYGKNGFEQNLIAMAFGIIAIFTAMEIRSPAMSNPQAIAPIRRNNMPDITKHKDFAHLINLFPDPVLYLEKSRIILANKAAQALLGNHIVSEDIRLAIRHPAAADLIMANSQDDRPIHLAGIGSRDQHWEMKMIQIDNAGKLILLWDRSGIYALEKMRTDFVANASHELRTPLSAIIGFIETLQDDETASDPAIRHRFLDIMLGEAQRMQKLIADLISLSRVEANRFTLPQDMIDLSLLAKETQQIFVQGQDERARDITLKIAENLPKVRGDQPQISQLLHNLVSNAMKYGRKGTPITVGLRLNRHGNMVRLTVSDEGEGIAAEHIPRLTERFYRIDSSRSRAIGGTGLGLAIVKHIVERHKGRLEIYSEENKGTRFIITLPVHQSLNDGNNKATQPMPHDAP